MRTFGKVRDLEILKVGIPEVSSFGANHPLSTLKMSFGRPGNASVSFAAKPPGKSNLSLPRIEVARSAHLTLFPIKSQKEDPSHSITTVLFSSSSFSSIRSKPKTQNRGMQRVHGPILEVHEDCEIAEHGMSTLVETVPRVQDGQVRFSFSLSPSLFSSS